MSGVSSSGWTSSVTTERDDLRGYRVACSIFTFTTGGVQLAALASPAGGPGETFLIAGAINPKITVPAGVRVSIQVVNADPDTAHGLVITSGQGRFLWMPVVTSRLAFSGSALWVLGNPTVVGIHVSLARLRSVQAGGGSSLRRCSQSPCNCSRRHSTAAGEIWLA